MANETRIIRYEYNIPDLFIGVEDTETDHVDYAESQARYDELVAQALTAAYPDDEIEVVGQANVTGWSRGVTIDGMSGTSEAAFVDDVIAAIYQAYDWVVWE